MCIRDSTWLVAGQLGRRAGQRRAAAAALDEAVRRFEALGAMVWLARTRREIAGLGLDRRATGASRGPDALTPSEARIAELAASGLTNRAVAERLLVSPKTVEASLARAYANLVIRSRAELGARFGRERGVQDLPARTDTA
jgi:DNA-binding NarL/FixJ family response regulator